MNLIIDIGNTIAKTAVFQRSELLEKYVTNKAHLNEKIQKISEKFLSIGAVVVSDVSAENYSLPVELFHNPFLLEISETTSLPFENLYETPETLGNDRKALVAAASKLFPTRNVLVIDAGSCITYDLKDEKNRYLGGAISPGLRMRLKSLHSFTGKLPEVEPVQVEDVLGRSTRGSILTGVIEGIRMEMDGFIDAYRERNNNLITILTGGDADFLSVNLKNSIFANSNFLLEGLNHILEFNTNR